MDEILRHMHTNLLMIEMAVPVKTPVWPKCDDSSAPDMAHMDKWRFEATRSYMARGKKLTPVYDIYVNGTFLKTVPDGAIRQDHGNND